MKVTSQLCRCQLWLTCALLALPATAAHAAPTWLTPTGLSTAGQNARAPQVAVDPQGGATAVWSRSNGTHTIVQGTIRPAGGPWQAPVDLSVAGHDAYAPSVAVDPQGNATAVWTRHDGTHDIVQGAIRPAGGAWQAPANLSTAGRDAYFPRVAVDPRGNATAVWIRFNGANFIVQGATRPAGGVWQTPLDLSAAGKDASLPQVAVDSQDGATAVWTRSNGNYRIAQGTSRPAAGTWQAPVDLSEDGKSADDPQVAVDPQGGATAVWRRSDGANSIVQGATRPAGGAWLAPTDLSVAGMSADDPQVEVDPQGSATAVWRRSNGANFIVQGATRPAGGAWQAPVNLSAVGQSTDDPQVAVDAAGRATAVWSRYMGTGFVVQGADRSSGGVWQTPVELSTPGQDDNSNVPQVAADAQGDAAAVWLRGVGPDTIVQSAALDRAGPRLGELSVPASGVVGQPVAFSVSPFDVWSPLGLTSWAFGDGSTGSGNAVTRAYVAAGSFTVTVTAADAATNTTAASRTITIAPAPPVVIAPAPAGPPIARRVPATISRLRMTPGRFRVATARTNAKKGQQKRGTQITLSLSSAASVRFTVERRAQGRRAGRQCVAPTTKNRALRACARFTRAPGTITRTRPAGPDKFAFSGQIGGRALTPGSYRLIATPVTAGRATAPSRLAFTVIRESVRARSRF